MSSRIWNSDTVQGWFTKDCAIIKSYILNAVYLTLDNYIIWCPPLTQKFTLAESITIYIAPAYDDGILCYLSFIEQNV